MTEPSIGLKTQKFFTVESNGQKTEDLPKTFMFKNDTTGVVQEDHTWVTSGKGGCFLRLTDAIVDAREGYSPGRLDPDLLQKVCRDHNETHHVPPFREDWSGWQWVNDRQTHSWYHPGQVPEEIQDITKHVVLPNGEHGYALNPKERPHCQYDCGAQDCGLSGGLCHLGFDFSDPSSLPRAVTEDVFSTVSQFAALSRIRNLSRGGQSPATPVRLFLP